MGCLGELRSHPSFFLNVARKLYEQWTFSERKNHCARLGWSWYITQGACLSRNPEGEMDSARSYSCGNELSLPKGDHLVSYLRVLHRTLRTRRSIGRPSLGEWDGWKGQWKRARSLGIRVHDLFFDCSSSSQKGRRRSRRRIEERTRSRRELVFVDNPPHFPTLSHLILSTISQG